MVCSTYPKVSQIGQRQLTQRAADANKRAFWVRYLARLSSWLVGSLERG